MFETILSYLSYAVALQGAFAVAVTGYTLVEHFSGKREDFRTSPEEEKIKLIFFAVWFLITLTGFYFDATSTPPFAQAFSLVDSELSVLLGYTSVFGSILCLAVFAPYKIGSSILYLYRNKDMERRSSGLDFHDDVYFGGMIVMETSIWTMLSGSADLGGEKFDVEITYPPLEDIPEPLRKLTRIKALERSKQFCEQLKTRSAEYRNGLAYLLSRDEKAAGKTLTAIAAHLQLSGAECDYWFEDGTELDSGTFALTFQNGNDFGEPEVAVGINNNGGVYLIDDAPELTEEELDSEEVSEADELTDNPGEVAVDEEMIDEIPVDGGDNNIKQSYL